MSYSCSDFTQDVVNQLIRYGWLEEIPDDDMNLLGVLVGNALHDRNLMFKKVLASLSDMLEHFPAHPDDSEADNDVRARAEELIKLYAVPGTEYNDGSHQHAPDCARRFAPAAECDCYVAGLPEEPGTGDKT